MAIELIDKLKPKNNGSFKIADTTDLDWSNGASVDFGKFVDTIDNLSLRDKLSGFVAPDATTIPILDNDKISELSAKGYAIPSSYVHIANADQNQTLRRVDTSTDKTYIDIMFSAIRSLQSEVAKLRNTMKYGVYSYNDTRTALGSVVEDYSTMDDNEPLWAIEESDLAYIDDCVVDISERHPLVPKDNVIVHDGYLELSSTDVSAKWIDDETKAGCCLNVTDAKLFLYLTVSTTNAIIKLTNLDNDENNIYIDLRKINLATSASGKYNILIVVSRAYKDTKTGTYYGKNFIWISACSYGTLADKVEGYWNVDLQSLQKPIYIIGKDYPIDKSRYFFKEVEFTGIQIYKFNMYSKYQDFSSEVLPSNPSDQTYKYEVAHITIRSVEDETVIKTIIKLLPRNELIYNKQNNSIYIVNEIGKYKKISGGGQEETGMTKAEISSWLIANGIHVTENGGGPLSIDNLTLGDITFINDDTGKEFKFTCDANGCLQSQEMRMDTLSMRILSSDYEDSDFVKNKYRGFISNLRRSELKKVDPSALELTETKDAKIYSDRVKIGAIYAPTSNRTNYGCSHAYIELENTSDTDVVLDGCYLHYGKTNSTSNVEPENYHTLALKGVLPANGTFVIRGKQYISPDDPNCIIKVTSYDQEWYDSNGDLVDFSLLAANSWLLVYDLKNDLRSSPMYTVNTDTTTNEKFPVLYNNNFIDVVSIGGRVQYNSSPIWLYGAAYFQILSIDCVYKNTFELDPAKQAFLSLTNGVDSSRMRNNSSTDFQYVLINDDKIEFPKTDETYPVDRYTPKSSKDKKNVSTDKSKLDTKRPNMVTCSFGIDMLRTRCFNWISTSLHDEYVWIKQKNTTTWARFESYKSTTLNDDSNGTSMSKKTFGNFNKMNKDGTTTLTPILSVIYDRITSVFPGCEMTYTAHKCIVDIVPNPVDTPTVFEYVVGRADKNDQPDTEHCSEAMTFTLYPKTYVPRIFQISDQQGFHWIEYQVWAAAAEELNKTISQISENELIIPILINTGDMTLNGTRINEWLDYYNAGKCLFNHLELMNVVGNNDLCGPDPKVLGTGDDPGKSNAYYFHVFYCYEINENILPIITNKNATRYIPSLYYFDYIGDSNSLRTVMVNSEITEQTCKTWYQSFIGDDTVNVYTGWPISQSSGKTYDSSFTTIYTLIYNMLNGYSGNKLVVCHEMPFTVITNGNLTSDKCGIDRSLKDSASGSLVGSHLNRLGSTDSYSNYWFSRLLELFNVKLCIGGHKHTYACTNPLREFYYYKDSDNNISCSINGKMEMTQTLSNDMISCNNVSVWKTLDGDVPYYSLTLTEYGKKLINTSKYPIMCKNTVSNYSGICISSDYTNPCYCCDTLTDGVVYFMLLATGFKLKSNKELPSERQTLSYIIPKTGVNAKGEDTPSPNQQRPMFAEIKLNNSAFDIYLYRIENIMDGTNLFSQLSYSRNAAAYKYLVHEKNSETESILFGKWVDNKDKLITVA